MDRMAPQELSRHMGYDSDTGIVFYLKNGKRAGQSMGRSGHLRFYLKGKTYCSARTGEGR